MNIDNNDQEFIDSIKSELNESVQNISAQDLSAIAKSRKKALIMRTERKSALIFISAGAIATACLGVVVYSFMQVLSEGQVSTQENMGVVSVLESLDLYEDLDIYEDIEFYEWLYEYESSSKI